MKNTGYLLLFIIGISIQGFSQETLMNPTNNTANKKLLKADTSVMSWFMLQDSLKIPIGNIQTDIEKKNEQIYIITTVSMKQAAGKWIDSTVVGARNFKPIYHSSYNQQRDMILKFGEKITGYYLDKQTNTNSPISEVASSPFFDSNFYPQLLRLLPLKNGYSTAIAIFDYNPKAKTGVLSATLKNTETTSIVFNGKQTQVWKLTTTDDISNNTANTSYFIEKTTRKLLKQEVDFGGRKMLMELIE